MSAQQFDEYTMLPNIIDDGTCDMCEDVAMPYNENLDYGFCPPHAIECETGVGLEDFVIHANTERNIELLRVGASEVINSGQCRNYACSEAAEPRLRPSDPLAYVGSIYDAIDLCTQHAVDCVMPSMLYPQNVGEFTDDIYVPENAF